MFIPSTLKMVLKPQFLHFVFARLLCFLINHRPSFNMSLHNPLLPITVIIPAYNEEKRIKQTLESYISFFEQIRNENKLDFEIIVVLIVAKFYLIVQLIINHLNHNMIIFVNKYRHQLMGS